MAFDTGPIATENLFPYQTLVAWFYHPPGIAFLSVLFTLLCRPGSHDGQPREGDRRLIGRPTAVAKEVPAVWQ